MNHQVTQMQFMMTDHGHVSQNSCDSEIEQESTNTDIWNKALLYSDGPPRPKKKVRQSNEVIQDHFRKIWESWQE